MDKRFMTEAQATKHTIRWFVYQTDCDVFGNYLGRTLVSRQSFHRPSAGWTGYEAKCSCGWETTTGGAIPAYIKSEINDHLWDVDPGMMCARGDRNRARRAAKWAVEERQFKYQMDQLDAEIFAQENGWKFTRLEEHRYG